MIAKHQQFGVVRSDRFVEATRDSGYKGTVSALSEVIDNSIQAGANEVRVKLIYAEPADQRMQPRVQEVVIADNGSGMSPEELRQALVFGGTARWNNRDGLGRFGMGLPNASVSQCLRLDVYTWQDGQEPYLSYLDVVDVARGKLSLIPPPKQVPLPAPYADLRFGESGTIVVWRRCDRLDEDAKLEALRRSLRFHLGRIFRHYIVNGRSLFLDDERVAPFDPLYLMPEARYNGDPLATPHGKPVELFIPTLEGKQSRVEVLFSLLPEAWQRDYRGDRAERAKRHIDETTGISVVRGGREIDIIANPYQTRHWSDAWYRIELRFEPELDEVFNVTHTKQHASIRSGTALYDRLRPIIRGNVTSMREAIVTRGKAFHQTRTRRAGADPAGHRVHGFPPGVDHPLGGGQRAAPAQ